MYINLNNVYKSYGKIEVLKGITFNFEASKKYIIKGENGMGKSTLLKAILNQIKYDGYIEVNGRIGYAPEGVILPSYMSFYKFVDTFSNLSGLVDDYENKFFNLTKLFNCRNIIYTNLGSLSKGQKQKANLMQSMLCNSDILILDEPLSGLDENSRKNLVNYLNNDKRLVIVITHEMKSFENTNFEVLNLVDGKIDLYPKKY